MSQSEKQLDILSGERIIKVTWPRDGESVDVATMRTRLLREIDQRDHRVPFDFRDVKGEPSELVSLLVELRRYCMDHSKILSTAWMKPELRAALDTARGRLAIDGRAIGPDFAEFEQVHPSTHEVANELLSVMDAEQGLEIGADEETESRHRSSNRKRPRHNKGRATVYRYASLVLAVLVVVVLAALIGAQTASLWQQDERIIIPQKGFE
ncbi:MAG: hypothetical protein AAGC97_15025 [Planctomycetota bacterium]